MTFHNIKVANQQAIQENKLNGSKIMAYKRLQESKGIEIKGNNKLSGKKCIEYSEGAFVHITFTHFNKEEFFPCMVEYYLLEIVKAPSSG